MSRERPRSTRVLVLDREGAFAEELRTGLGRLGCEVRVTDDGDLGMRLALADPPDLIMLAIELPGRNGFAVCNKMRKEASLKDVPLVLLSSEATDETFEQHAKLRTRADVYVKKPVAFAELVRRIHPVVPLSEATGPTRAREQKSFAAVDLRVDLARAQDVPRIVELSNWAAAHTPANFATKPESLEQWLEAWQRTSRAHPWLVARSQDGDVVGFAKTSPHRIREAYDWTAEVSVYVDPDAHGRGVGTLLYEALIPLLREQGYVTLLGGVTEGHGPSERLHAKTGFVRCGTFHRVGWKFNRWLDVGYWELHLQPAGHAPQPIRPVDDVWHERQG